MENGKVVGFICGSINGEKEARIMILVVDKEYRGQGIGRKLLELFEEEAKKLKVEKMRLEVKTSNKVAISLYKKIGFIISNMLPAYYNDGSDAYVMQKFI